MFKLLSIIYCSRIVQTIKIPKRYYSNLPKVKIITNHDEYIEISFHYADFSDSYISLKAPKQQPLQEVLSDIKHKLSIQCAKEKLKNVFNSYLCSSAIDISKILKTKEVEVNLVLKEGKLKENIINIDAWTPDSFLKVGDSLYEVNLNPPTVLELNLPENILSGCFIRPNFKLECASKDDCCFSWYRSMQNLSSDMSVSSPTETLVEWQKVCDEFVYQTSSEDIGHKFKLECTPKLGSKSGSPLSVISSNVVEAGPEVFPFEKRHVYTKDYVDENSIRCMTYNVLASCYVERRRRNRFLYCTKKARKSCYRRQLLKKEVLGYKSDIICFQEMEKKSFDNDLVPVLKTDGLKGYYFQKGGGGSEGTAIFYRTTKFKVIQKHYLHLNNIIKNKEIFADLLEKISGNLKLMRKILTQETVLQIIALEHVHQPQRKIIVANTHLCSNEDTAGVRLVQTAICTQYIEHLLKTKKNLNSASVIFCGDFNSTADTPTYDFIVNGKFCSPSSWENNLTGDSSSTIKHNMGLESACGIPEYTNYTEDFYGCLDYIFYNPDNLCVSEVVPMPSHEDVTQHVALPSELFPSDHIPLICTLKWKDLPDS